MKKSILSLGLFAGATLSIFALTSCNNGKFVVKDFDGKDFTIEKSEDKEVVAKALIYSANAMMSSNVKHYAFGTDIAFELNAGAKYSGVTIGANLNANAKARLTMGTATYDTLYNIETESSSKISDEQEAAAYQKFVENARAEMILGISASTTATVDEGADTIAQSIGTMLNGQSASVDVALFTAAPSGDTPFTVYSEGNATMSKTLYEGPYQMVAAMMPDMMAEILDFQADGDTYKAALAYKMPVPSIPHIGEYTTIFAYYQSDAFAEKAGKLFTADFFESKSYEQMLTAIETCGIKITNVAGSKVTFGMDFTGKAITDLVTSINSTAGAALELEPTKNFGKAEVTIDVANCYVSDLLFNVTDASFLNGVVPMVTDITGSIKLTYKLVVDGEVKFTKTPDSQKTYLPFGFED